LDAATGVAAYPAMLLTDSLRASIVTFGNGHGGQSKKIAPVDWSRISRKSTVVIFMGLDQLPAITDRLLHHLWDEKMPAVAVRWGSTPQQVVVEGTLGDIANRTREAGLASPVLIIIGKVV